MTEPHPDPDPDAAAADAQGPQDATRRRFRELLAAKQAGHDEAGSTGNTKRGGPAHLPGAKSGRTFRRRKV